jgi:hypothetical protein
MTVGRKCDICGSDLYDTIINFGENLPEIPLQRAWEVYQQHQKISFDFKLDMNNCQ